MNQQIARPHFHGLNTAFLQLSFAMKLWHYVLEHSLHRETFDISLTIEEENGSRYVMNDGEFTTDDDLVHAAGNNIGICFGIAAITLWEAIREHSGLESKSLNPSASDREMLAGLAFAVRCCFAHGTVMPKWRLAPKYQIEYRLGGRDIDLRHADGTPFDYAQLGGVDSLRMMWQQAQTLSLL